MPDLAQSDNQATAQRQPQQFLLPQAELWLWKQWLPTERAQAYFSRLQQELNWQQPQLWLFGKAVCIPRRQVWMGDAHCSYRYSGVTFQPEPWHPLVWQLTLWVNRQLKQQFNAVLLNLYQQGDDHMGWHSDDEPELGIAPDIASLSLGQSRRFDLKHKTADHQLSLMLEDGDLLLMRAPCQQFWQHRVPKQAKAGSARLNLTFRYIKSAP
ncbi:alpha-ketoglutarate-dependent dioxygenase AlkB [Rheinheimera sp.]|uniref:alpha-ketoglutarate-dependent dioxygenase AlkB family protein n=1 Tax=Rheinheimera sp. TaxID=1869214 RepID=UPI0027BA8224|nr:alpha-ketoglutarate-dependent dioxygenase AlkB [Rheinheimera sp.]